MLALLDIYDFAFTISLIQITLLLRYFLSFFINSLLVLAPLQHMQWSTRGLSRSLIEYIGRVVNTFLVNDLLPLNMCPE